MAQKTCAISIFDYEPSFIRYNQKDAALLPIAELPKFDGDPKLFAEFKRQFAVIVGKYQLEDDNQLRVLRMCLVGGARKGVQYLPSRVEHALRKLEEWFGADQTFLVAQLPSIRNSTSPIELYEFWSTATRKLKNCQENCDFLVEPLKQKLPRRLVSQLTSVTTIPSLLSKIHWISRLEMSSNNKDVIEKQTERRKKEEEKTNECRFCFEEGHQQEDCKRYDTPERRKTRAITLKLCFACLRSDHSFQQCRNPCVLCYRCNEEHKFHAFLCKFTPKDRKVESSDK